MRRPPRSPRSTAPSGPRGGPPWGLPRRPAGVLLGHLAEVGRRGAGREARRRLGELRPASRHRALAALLDEQLARRAAGRRLRTRPRPLPASGSLEGLLEGRRVARRDRKPCLLAGSAPRRGRLLLLPQRQRLERRLALEHRARERDARARLVAQPRLGLLVEPKQRKLLAQAQPPFRRGPPALFPTDACASSPAPGRPWQHLGAAPA